MLHMILLVLCWIFFAILGGIDSDVFVATLGRFDIDSFGFGVMVIGTTLWVALEVVYFVFAFLHGILFGE